MLILKNPWVILLIPVVLFLTVFLKKKQQGPLIRFPSVNILKNCENTLKIKLLFLPFFLRMLALGFFIFALAGPRSVLEQTIHKTEGIDIVLALDCSGSMAAEDFTLNGKRFNRLTIVKDLTKDFIESRSNDRIGLVTFAALAYTVCPLTTDHAWLSTNLERIQLGLIQDGTAIGSAILSSVQRIKDSKAKSKIIVVLTDGVSNAGKIGPLPAAETARSLGIKVYTIGAGTKGYAPFPAFDIWGQKVYQKVKVELDEVTLKKIADLTGGQYYRATDTESLRQIYQQIDRLEKTEIENVGYKEYKELFPFFLLIGLGILFLEMILKETVFLRIP